MPSHFHNNLNTKTMNIRLMIDKLILIIGLLSIIYSIVDANEGFSLDDRYQDMASIERAKLNMSFHLKMVSFFMLLTLGYQFLIAAEHPQKGLFTSYIIMFCGISIVFLQKFELSYIGCVIFFGGIFLYYIESRKE
jgi:hypothetical protein